MAQGRDADFYRSELAFNSMDPQTRVFFQLALTAAGYWPAVPNQTYSLRLHREVLRFQADHGLPARGFRTEKDAEVLASQSIDAMVSWIPKILYHPTRPHYIVVPSGLDLVATPLNGGVHLKSTHGRFQVRFIAIDRGSAGIEDAFAVTKREMIKTGDRITYQILKDSFFVIQGEQGPHKRYSRFHLDGQYITGFDMFWSGDGPPVYGDRLVTIVSGSLWSSMTGSPYPTFPRFELPWQRPETVPYVRNVPSPASPPLAAAPSVTAKAEPSPQTERKKASSGSGFFVTREGHIVTNEHVIDACLVIDATPPGREPQRASVIAKDKKNDLAILKIASNDHAVARIRLGTRLGEAVAVFGYPLSAVLASTGNFTLGNITALAGIGDDARFLQISAPVQAGNSGGPLLDESGNVIGVVSSKMDAIVATVHLGDMPQNVNFAIKATTLVNFLEANGIFYDTGQPGEAFKPTDLADRAKAISVQIRCQ